MATTATAVLSRYVDSGTPAFRIITIRAESAMMYGITFVTTARFTSALNCSLSVGEMVESAISDCTIAITIMPMIGASFCVTRAKNEGNMRCSDADFAVCAIVNCQPSSEPRQAIAASAITIEPMTALN